MFGKFYNLASRKTHFILLEYLMKGFPAVDSFSFGQISTLINMLIFVNREFEGIIFTILS